MAQYPTKVLANTYPGAPSSDGYSGVSGKYYKYDYFVTGTAAAVTAVPLGVAPAKCHYVGCSTYMGSGTGGTLAVTVSPLLIPYDANGTTVALNSTNPVFGTPVATFPASTTTINFDGAGSVTTHGQNGTSTGTGITDAVLKTGSTVQFRQGDFVGLTTSGTFTGSGGFLVEVWLQEDQGQTL